MVDKVQLRRWVENGLNPTPSLPPLSTTPTTPPLATSSSSTTPPLVTPSSSTTPPTEFKPIEASTDVQMIDQNIDSSVDVKTTDILSKEREPSLTIVDDDAIIVEEEVFDPNVIKNSALLCPHGNVAIGKMDQVKIMGQVGFSFLSLLRFEWDKGC